MGKFEYLRIALSTHHPRSNEVELLNAAGREGWRLVWITAHGLAYLTREIAEAPKPRRKAVDTGTGSAPQG